MSAEAERLCNEGLELMTQHRWEEAEEKMQMALGHDDDSPEIWYNFGKCRFHQDRYEDAINALLIAVDLKRFYHEAHALLGSCYYAIHDMYKARKMFTRALSGDMSNDFNRECLTASAHCYLAEGAFKLGFEEYEHRLKEPNTWNGTQSLVGKTLLVKAEGGLGDQIFFARYATMLWELGPGHVIWEVDEPLVQYFQIGVGYQGPGLQTIKRGDIVEHDYMVHAGSLPYIFGTKMGTLPVFGNAPSYVKNPKRIGIACSGNPLHPDDHHRSIPLAEFKPLLSSDKDFYFVQKDVRATDIPESLPYTHLAVEDVLAMSRWIRTMGLVITVDTMTAHLAGAEGVPTWLLLPYACDWRWGLEGDRTPWYPSMRIFRQGPDRKWGPVIQRVVEELKK